MRRFYCSEKEGESVLGENDIIGQFRVVLKQEYPSSNIRNTHGTLKLEKKAIHFIPHTNEESYERIYEMNDLNSANVNINREWMRKKKTVELKFIKKQVSVTIDIEPIDVSPEFLLQEIIRYRDEIKRNSPAGIFGSLIEKIGIEGQKIVKEVGAVIQSSTQDLSHAIDQSIQFIREATRASNILESIEIKGDDKTINLDTSDIDEILKRSLASDKIEAMIAGLIAKGLLSAKDQKFDEALEALKIAQEAAKKENMTEYSDVAKENINQIEAAESRFDGLDPNLGEKAAKYAKEARDIVAEWEKSKKEGEENFTP